MEAYDRATKTNILKKCQKIPSIKLVLTSHYLCAHTKFREKLTFFAACVKRQKKCHANDLFYTKCCLFDDDIKMSVFRQTTF
jgi:hypothetical protein